MDPTVKILKGTEKYLIDLRLAQIIEEIELEAGELELIKLDGQDTTPAELEQYLAELPLFAHQRLLVYRYPIWLESNQGKKARSLQDYERVMERFLESPVPGLYLVIITSGNPVGALKKRAVIEEIKSLNSQGLSQWLNQEARQRGIKLSRAALEQLVKSGRDMYYLLNEMERLSLSHPGSTISPEQLQIVSDLNDYHIFKLTEAIMKKKTAEALKVLSILLQKGEPCVLIIHMISREFILLGKSMALYRSGLKVPEIAERLKKQPFRIERMMAAAFDEDALPRVFLELAEADLKIKSTSQDERLVLETAITAICG